MKLIGYAVAVIVLMVICLVFVRANCMEKAQEFKCTYKMLKCTDNLNGECECEDG